MFTAVLALAVAPTLAQKPYAGTATGVLTVDGKPIPIKYAYVVEVDNVEEAGLLMSGPRKSMVIVLSDRTLPLASVCDRNAPYSDRHSPAQMIEPQTRGVADKMYGILLKIEPGKANPFEAQLLYPNHDSISFSVEGTQYPDRVTEMKREGGVLSGTCVSAMQATGLEKGPKKYQYRATFRAPILTEPPVTQTLEGADALRSAPVAAIKAYGEAGKKGDVETLRKLTATTHLVYLTSKSYIESLKSFEVAKLPEQVKRVVIRGNTATVVVVSEQPSYSQVLMRLMQEQGDWKLYWP